MRKPSDIFTHEAAQAASQAAANAIWSQNDGVDAYDLCGKILIACGIAWGLITFIPLACGSTLGDCLWIFVVTVGQIAAGSAVAVLVRKSSRFQNWVQRGFEKNLDRWTSNKHSEQPKEAQQ